MIKRFHVLYLGQIALDNVGRNGTPANERRYPNERLSEALWNARDIARVMDECGFYALWTAEHHFEREGYECLPNLVQLGLWLATQTRRLKFGCAFNILPMWHPIRLAEDYAMADIVTEGRIIMGVGRGYHTREVETFGGPPDEVIAGIRSIEAKYPGLEDFMVHWAEGMGPEEFARQLRWFARDVMPAFGAGARAEAAAAG